MNITSKSSNLNDDIEQKKIEKRTLIIFSAASFLNDFGSDMIASIWPVFVTKFLGASVAFLGFLDGLGDALVSISQAISGILSDKIKKRKVFIWLGYLCAAIGRFGYLFAKSYQHLIPAKALDRLGKLRDAPRDAYLSQVTHKTHRGKYFGILHGMDSLGAICGILLAFALFPILSYKNLILVAVIPSFLSVLLILFFISEIKQKNEQITTNIIIVKNHYGKSYIWFLIISAIFGLGFFTYSLLLLAANFLGFKESSIPMLYLIFTAASSFFAAPLGSLSDRLGSKNMVLISYVLWALTGFGFWLQLKFLLFVPMLFVIAGIQKAAFEVGSRTYISDIVPAEKRAGAFGIFRLVIGIMALPASFAAGLLWDKIGFEIPFLIAITTAFVASFLLKIKKT